jgi:hypothetical protein
MLSVKFPASPAEACDAALGFQSLSQGGCIWNSVADVDGYHLQIQTPSKAEAKMLSHYSRDITKHMERTSKQRAMPTAASPSLELQVQG